MMIQFVGQYCCKNHLEKLIPFLILLRIVPPQQEPDHASSNGIGIIVIITIVVILAVLVLVMFLRFELPHADEEAPVVFKITNVVYTIDPAKVNIASYVVLTNSGKQSYRNRYLFVKLFVNDNPANLNLPTLNGDASCNLHHYGVKNIGGLGTEGEMDKSTSKWYPEQTIFIDFNDGTFRPGDTISIEVYDGLTGKILSRDTYPPEKKYTAKWFYNHFLNHQAA